MPTQTATTRSQPTTAATTSATATERLLRLVRHVTDLVLLAVIAVGLATVILGRLIPAIGHPVLIVAGPSMEPAIPLGAAVILADVAPEALRVGDVVSLRSGPSQAIFTHRITRVVERDGSPWIETRGDANAAADASLTPASAILGRVAVTLPVAGYLLTLLSSPIGIVFALSLGGVLLVAGWLLDDLIDARRRRRVAVATPVIRGRRRMAARPPVVAR
jgi:signal peptidase